MYLCQVLPKNITWRRFTFIKKQLTGEIIRNIFIYSDKQNLIDQSKV